jgi:hypothetical protein
VKLSDHSADRLSTRTALLLTGDPGAAVLDAARLYDPKARCWLAGQPGGIALDMLGFIIDSPGDLVPRSR